MVIITGQIYQHFLWLEKSPLTYLINKEDEINYSFIKSYIGDTLVSVPKVFLLQAAEFIG